MGEPSRELDEVGLDDYVLVFAIEPMIVENAANEVVEGGAVIGHIGN